MVVSKSYTTVDLIQSGQKFQIHSVSFGSATGKYWHERVVYHIQVPSSVSALIKWSRLGKRAAEC